MEVNTEAWSVGKYAKRSCIIHLNSDAEAVTARLQSGSITAVNANGAGGANLRITLDANRLAGVAVSMFLRVVVTTVATGLTATHFREIAAFNGATDVDIAVAVPDLTNANINNVTHRATFEIFDKGFSPGSSNVNFPVTIPNYIGYPEHQRCLVQVLSMATVPQGNRRREVYTGRADAPANSGAGVGGRRRPKRLYKQPRIRPRQLHILQWR